MNEVEDCYQKDLSGIFDIDELVMSSTAYFLGRKTALTHSFCEKLIESWPYLRTPTQLYIVRIVEECFGRDDHSRNMGRENHPLGHDCDRAIWEKVRKCWNDKP